MTIPTTEEVLGFLAVNKTLLRQMEWTPRLSRKHPQWWNFYSVCSIGNTETIDIMFRAQYKPGASIVKGSATIVTAEIIYVGLFIGEHRVSAMDTNVGQKHTNKIGEGLPYFGKTVESSTHIHIWTEQGDGYVEPVEPPLFDIKELFLNFFDRVNLVLTGNFVHPLKGRQLDFTESWTVNNY